MGIFKKFGFGLKKTREGMTGRIEDVLGAYEEITDDFYDDLEEALIMGDIGMKTATDIVEELRKRVNHNEVRNPKHAKMIISDIIADMIDGGEDMVNAVGGSPLTARVGGDEGQALRAELGLGVADSLFHGGCLCQ